MSVTRQLTLRRRPGRLLDGLNDGQRRAAQTVAGPVMVLAGAGTGKTTTIVVRTAVLIQAALVPPERILCATFKSDAGRELAERLAARLGDAVAARLSWVGTYHGMGARLLRDRPGVAGLRSGFRIVDEPGAARCVAEALQALAGEAESDPSLGADLRAVVAASLAAPPKEWVELLQARIQALKGAGTRPEDVAAEPLAMLPGGGPEAIAGRVYAAYQARLRQANLADFGDLLLWPTVALRDDETVARRWRGKFLALISDEHQDSSPWQFYFLRLLAGDRTIPGHRNLCVVGDDDQSLYGWRQADPRNILEFTEHYPDAAIIRLEENYRNPPLVLDVANRLIGENRDRMGKTLRVADARGTIAPIQTRIPVLGFRDDAAEAAYIAAAAQESDAAGRSVAVIYRINALSRVIEEAFLRAGVPYELIGQPTFWSRAVVQDILAYARLWLDFDPAPDAPPLEPARWEQLQLAFARVADRPARRIGDVTVAAIRTAAEPDRRHPLAAALALAAGGGLRRDTGDGVAAWAAAFREAGDGRRGDAAALEGLLKAVGYLELIAGEDEDREHLAEVVGQAARHPTIGAWIAETDAMLSRAATVQRDDDGRPRPRLMTGHAAKGLEFDDVFLPGWEEGLLPHQKAIDAGHVEEERRIAYVGLTRARRTVTISHVGRRRGPMEPSCFIDDLPAALIERRLVRPAHPRQLAYAADIAGALGLPPPGSGDADAVSAFIRAHETAFRSAGRQRRAAAS